MALLVNDVMLDIGYALLQTPVNTTLGTNVSAGIATASPGSMVGIYMGAILVVGANGNADQEAVTVASVTSSTFTATFANAHPNTDPILTATFPSGQTDNYLFTQAEVLGYLTDAHQDFLLKVRPIYATGSVTLQVGKKVYAAPSNSIRVEHASIVNTTATPPTAQHISNVAQTDLDLMQYAWEQSSDRTEYWFQDQINTQTIGFGPIPQVGNNVSLFYSQNAITALTLTSNFLVPDPMTVALKWRVLSVCYSKDGEMRDPRKAAFAQQFYDMLVLASQKFMAGVSARAKTEEETVEPLAMQRM